MLTTIFKIIVAPLVFVLTAAGYSVAPQQPNLGAALPAATAVFQTSLAAPITSSATTMTLTANSVRGGGSLSGFNCFSVDEGSAQAETICGTVSGTTVSSLTRGVSQSTGTTTVSALQFSHRRGANVKITDFPLIQILKAQNNGEDTFNNPLVYNSIATTTVAANRNYLASVGLVQDIAFNGAGVIDATTAAKGVVELATGAEAAASTANGSAGILALPATLATSTWNSGTAANRIPVTGVSTKTIDPNFLNLASYTGNTQTTNLTATGTVSVTGTTTLATTTPIFLSTIQKIFATTTDANINTTNETSFFSTTTLPAYTLSGGVLKASFIFSTLSNYGNCGAMTVKVYLGGSSVTTLTPVSNLTDGTIQNLNLTIVDSGNNTQEGYFDMGTTTTNTFTSSVSTKNSAVAFGITGSRASASGCTATIGSSYASIIR